MTPEKSMENMRNWVRAPVVADVSLQFDAFDEMFHGFSANISAGGMFVAHRTPPPVGAVLRFELNLEDGARPILGIGEVIWIRVRQEGAGQPQGMGIRFLFVKEEDRERINQMVHSHRG